MDTDEKHVTIPFDNLAEALINVVPALKPQYESELHWWGEEKPGVHIIFGDILTPYILTLLESNAQEEMLQHIFAFLEQLANQQDLHVQEVVSVSVCERLGDKQEWLAKARTYMGPATLHLSQEIEAFWGREKR